MTGFVFSSTLKDLLRPQRIFVWLAVVCVVFVISKIWSVLADALDPSDSFVRVLQAVVLRVVALAAAIFGTMVISHEVEQKTIVYSITRPLPRWKLILGRMLAASLATCLVSVLSLLAAALAVGGLDKSLLFDAVTIAAGAPAYVAFFVFLSLTMNRPLIVSLLFAFGWETFVPNMPGDMFYLSILTYMRSTSGRAVVAAEPSLGDFATGSLVPRTVPTGTAWLVLLLLVVALWWLCLWWFSRFEYSPREDSD